MYGPTIGSSSAAIGVTEAKSISRSDFSYATWIDSEVSCNGVLSVPPQQHTFRDCRVMFAQ